MTRNSFDSWVQKCRTEPGKGSWSARCCCGSIPPPGQADQQVVSSDLFGGGRREKTSSLRRPKWSILRVARQN